MEIMSLKIVGGQHHSNKTIIEEATSKNTVVVLEIPFPPSINSAYPNRGGKGRNRYRSAEYEAWLMECALIILMQKPENFGGKRVDVWIALDDSRQGDCDSRLKVCLDLLVKNEIIQDDRKR